MDSCPRRGRGLSHRLSLALGGYLRLHSHVLLYRHALLLAHLLLLLVIALAVASVAPALGMFLADGLTFSTFAMLSTSLTQLAMIASFLMYRREMILEDLAVDLAEGSMPPEPAPAPAAAVKSATTSSLDDEKALV